MNTILILKYLRYATYVLSAFLVLAIGLSVYILEATKMPPEVRNRIMSDLNNQFKNYSNFPLPWPPQMNKQYPDIGLIDQEGKAFKLSDFRGKIILIETIDMAMAQSQAYSGAATFGPFGAKTAEVDKKLQPIQAIIGKYSEGKITLPNPDIIYVKIIFYNATAAQALPTDATNWAEHFKLSKADNIFVAVPDKDLRIAATTSLLPGFQLIDRAFNLRVDSSGLTPKHNLEMTLIPLIPKLL